VGKPVTTADATNTGYVSASSLATWFGQAYTDLGWNAGFMVWQYSSDANGAFAATVSAPLL